MNRTPGLHRRLLLMYSALLLAVVSASFLAFYLYISRQQESIYNSSFARELSAYVNRVDNAIANADRQLAQIKSHRDIAPLFYRLSLASDASGELASHPEWTAAVRDAIDEIRGLDPQVFQRVTIYHKSGAYIGTGVSYPEVPAAEMRDRMRELETFQYDDTFRLIRYPAADLLETHRPPVLSLIRKISYSGLVHSFAEIQLSGEFFAKQAAAALPAAGVKRSLYVYSSAGQWHSIEPEDGAPLPEWLPKQPELLPDLHTDKNGSSLMLLQRSDNTGWVYAMTLPRSSLNVSLRKLGLTVLALGLLVSAAGLFAIHLSTRRALQPLHRLRKAMGQIDYDSLDSQVPESLLRAEANRRDISEIRELRNSFTDMLSRLQQSKLETHSAREAEFRARLLSLQKQVDPHFLYNTLSLIGMLGFGQGDKHILQLSRSLIQMFQYTTYGDSYRAALGQELQHLEEYLRIMSIRYEHKLTYDIQVPESMSELYVPKLFLQPIAENAFKHGFTEQQELWRIEVRGWRSETAWQLEIEDNGRGFSDEARERLTEMWRTIGETGMAETNRGLANTLTRLRFVLGLGVSAEFGTGELGGALVRIRMSIEPEEGEETDHASANRTC